ncbi:PASTA domain-containing protein [Nocardiopsis sp. NRRL B-16309]|uniref:PASTA domain-containing protein n=1 Tax=Nocardiopsis sp. NRRL B-16309 TaxID=1519494 RepID=UPI0006AFC628|nr:PASTA domain-containing protein [Nocardiopsis sp. NRRL B-16309]KOX13864.1 serine/threonine protein kinase [Nocardiopsis sp. NRRL B-16309]
MATPSPDTLFGLTLHGRYVLGQRVRSGPSGTVHTAHDLTVDHLVMVTVMHPESVADAGAVHAFDSRVQTLESVTHPGLARTLGHGRDGDHVYAVTEYERGESLASVLTDGDAALRYSPATALTIVADVLGALDALHQAGIVHGAVEADHVLLDDDGRVTVTGLPLIADTTAGREPDTSEDVHAVGRLLHTLITGVGTAPHEGPLRPSEAVDGVPSDVDMLVANATDPTPRYRPRDAAKYLTMVEQVTRSLPRADGDGDPADTRPIPVVGPETLAQAGAGSAFTSAFRAGRASRRAPGGASGPTGGGTPGRGRDGAPPWRRLPVLVSAAALAVVLLAVVGWAALAPDDAVVVPDVTGSAPGEAEAVLTGLGADLVVRRTEAYDDAVETGAVAATEPAAGTEVETGDQVTLVVSIGARSVEVPDVAGGTESEARTALREAGFTDIEVVQEHSGEEAPGTVLSTKPAAGEQGDREEPVVVSVSEGNVVPSLIGVDQAEAVTLLDEAGLAALIVEEPHDEVVVGEVFGQDPEPGSILPDDANVAITVSTGPEEPEVEESETEDDEEERDADRERDRDEPTDEEEDPDRGDDDDGWGGGRGDDDASCSGAAWHPHTQYDTGDRVHHQGREYEARWWVQGAQHRPGDGGDWGPWADLGPC